MFISIRIQPILSELNCGPYVSHLNIWGIIIIINIINNIIKILTKIMARRIVRLTTRLLIFAKKTETFLENVQNCIQRISPLSLYKKKDKRLMHPHVSCCF